MTASINASTSAGVIVTSDTSGALALQTAGTTALTISSAQVVNFANAPTVAGSPIGASQATATTLGTVYAKQTTGGGTPYLTAFGYNAGVSTTGASNTAIGTEALYTNSTGTENTALGYQAIYSGNGSYNTAFGAKTLYANTANSNCGFGYHVMLGTTSGAYNTGMGGADANGVPPLVSNITGSYNTAIGNGSLGSNTGSYNSAVGYQALISNTTSSYNTALGYQAGNKITGQYNTAIGALSIQTNTSSGDYNTSLGANSLNSLNGGSSNAGVGYSCLYGVTSGGGNTAIGYTAGAAVNSGTYNVFLGYGAGYAGFGTNLTTGSNCIFIGNAAASAAGSTYEIVIGNGAGGKGGSTCFISPAGGGVYQGNNTATWSVVSDQRLKKNIVENTVGLESINAIRVCNFEYRTEDEVTDLPKNQAINKQGVQLGAIAQELQAILPDCVKEQTTGVLSVNTDNMIWHMINAIKELSAELNALKAKVGA